MHLERNPELAKRVHLNDYGLAHERGAAEFFTSRNVDAGYSAGGYFGGAHLPVAGDRYERAGFAARQVRVEPLDNFVRERGIERVAFVKIDVEGSEGRVLEGARRTLSTHKPVLMIEVHSVLAMREVCEVLLPLGYELEVLDSDPPGQCFVAAHCS